MTRGRSPRLDATRALAVTVLLLTCSVAASAQETVRISAPVAVLFQVADVSQSVTSAKTTLTFDTATLVSGHALRISVKADDDLKIAGASIAASKVSWTTSAVTHGVGVDGTLSAATFTEVYESKSGADTGKVSLQWTLAGSAGVQRAGTYQTTLRWKIESVVP
jgi:hypothetical protein